MIFMVDYRSFYFEHKMSLFYLNFCLTLSVLNTFFSEEGTNIKKITKPITDLLGMSKDQCLTDKITFLDCTARQFRPLRRKFME